MVPGSVGGMGFPDDPSPAVPPRWPGRAGSGVCGVLRLRPPDGDPGPSAGMGASGPLQRAAGPRAGARAALARLLGEDDVTEAARLCREAAGALEVAGRPLAAANADLPSGRAATTSESRTQINDHDLQPRPVHDLAQRPRQQPGQFPGVRGDADDGYPFAAGPRRCRPPRDIAGHTQESCPSGAAKTWQTARQTRWMGPRHAPRATQMRIFCAGGGPGRGPLRETADPEPGPGQVRIRVRVAGLNFSDVMAAQGLYPGAPETAGRGWL